jgi:EipB-like
MRGPVSFASALLALFLPQLALAQVQPHHAVYGLRLGAAANAPRIGTAVQDLTVDCSGWHLKRDINTEIAVTSAWKISIASKLDAEEALSGNALRYRTVQIQNGLERETRGRVQRAGKDKEMRADIVTPTGPAQFTLPPSTLLPIAAINYLIERLGSKASAFPALTFDAEVAGDAFLVDVTELNDADIRPPLPGEKPAILPKIKAWPVFMTFTRGRQQNQKPLFSVKAVVFANGVLDRLTVDTGLVQVTADLQELKMGTAPVCPRS